MGKVKVKPEISWINLNQMESAQCNRPDIERPQNGGRFNGRIVIWDVIYHIEVSADHRTKAGQTGTYLVPVHSRNLHNLLSWRLSDFHLNFRVVPKLLWMEFFQPFMNGEFWALAKLLYAWRNHKFLQQITSNLLSLQSTRRMICDRIVRLTFDKRFGLQFLNLRL